MPPCLFMFWYSASHCQMLCLPFSVWVLLYFAMQSKSVFLFVFVVLSFYHKTYLLYARWNWFLELMWTPALHVVYNEKFILHCTCVYVLSVYVVWNFCLPVMLITNIFYHSLLGTTICSLINLPFPWPFMQSEWWSFCSVICRLHECRTVTL